MVALNSSFVKTFREKLVCFSAKFRIFGQKILDKKIFRQFSNNPKI